MNCKYIFENEIYEKYLLGNLSAEDNSEFEQHLSGCAACREELEKQRFLISSVRSVGKREMKEEIRRQVKDIRAQKQSPDWQMILKVAAVVFIIALIPSIIYYFQTESGKPLSPITANEQSVTEESHSFASKQSAQQKDLPGKSGEVIESKELADKDEPRKKQPKVAIPLANQSISEADMKSMAATAPAETASIAAILQDSLAKAEMVKTLQAESQSSKLIAQIDTNQIDRDIAQGTKYYFAQIDKKKSRLGAGETGTLQMLDEVATQKFAPNTGRQANKIRPEGTLIASSVVYETDHKKITVSFDSSEDKFRIDQGSPLPQSFDVQVLNHDSLNWEMIWQVKLGFLDYNPSQMEIVMENQIMYLIIFKKYIYRIDLNSDSPKAVLVKK